MACYSGPVGPATQTQNGTTYSVSGTISNCGTDAQCPSNLPCSCTFTGSVNGTPITITTCFPPLQTNGQPNWKGIGQALGKVVGPLILIHQLTTGGVEGEGDNNDDDSDEEGGPGEGAAGEAADAGGDAAEDVGEDLIEGLIEAL
jgi:hypothetical protein